MSPRYLTLALFASLPPERQNTDAALEAAWQSQSSWLDWTLEENRQRMAEWGGPKTASEYWHAHSRVETPRRSEVNEVKRERILTEFDFIPTTLLPLRQLVYNFVCNRVYTLTVEVYCAEFIQP